MQLTFNDKGNYTFCTTGVGDFLSAAPSAILYWDKVFAPVAIRGMDPPYDAAVDRMTQLGIAASADLKSENSISASDIPGMMSKYSVELQRLERQDGEDWSVMLTCPPLV
ncbi:hypothetical protein, partial [Leisingera sp. UBA4491]|uniref:hypothetical protein n=1 Tax=Leisingera sp. UBA4491 TaxID=1946748 RepID=UPI00257B4F73